jgi:hypothetical protein
MSVRSPLLEIFWLVTDIFKNHTAVFIVVWVRGQDASATLPVAVRQLIAIAAGVGESILDSQFVHGLFVPGVNTAYEGEQVPGGSFASARSAHPGVFIRVD